MNVTLSGEYLEGYSAMFASSSARYLSTIEPLSGNTIDPIVILGYAPYTKLHFRLLNNTISASGDNFLINTDEINIPSNTIAVVDFQDIITGSPPISSTVQDFLTGNYSHTYIQPGKYETKVRFFANSQIIHTFYISSVVIDEISPSPIILVLKDDGTVYDRKNPPLNTPATLQLCASGTIDGSFLLERLDWDLGDGSPIITITRNIPFSPEAIFVESISNSLSAFTDSQDPRNYLIRHTYHRYDFNDTTTFSPTVIAYSRVTNKKSSITYHKIGPIKLPLATKRKLIKNRMYNAQNDILLAFEDENLTTYQGVISASDNLFYA